MILTERVSLGGKQLDEIDEMIVIRKVDTGVSHEAVQAANRMGGFGQRMTMQHWETLEVNVTFAIDISKRELARRREVFDAVMDWAKAGAKAKGWLRTTSQPGKRMRVDKVVLPSAGDLREWTKDYTITFRAYGVPFWQENNPAELEVKSISNGTKSFEVGGIERTVAEVTAKNISGQTIADFTITVGSNTMTFKGLNLLGTETLHIYHGSDGLLRIRAETASGYRNVFSLRTTESADDLYVDPGTVNVKVESKRAVQLTVTAAGRWAS